MSRLRLTAVVTAFTLLAAGLGTPASAAPTTLHGVVSDFSTGAPLDGACVAAFRLESAGLVQVGDEICTTAGAYAFTDLPEGGPVRLRARAAGYADVWYPSATSAGSAMPVALSTTTSLDMRLFMPGTVTGVVTSSTDAPVANRLMSLWPLTGGSTYSGRTNATGRYTITGVRPGVYTIQVGNTGYDVEWIPNRQTRAEAQQFTVEPGGTVNADTKMFPPYGEVVVTVLDDATGQPVTEGCLDVNGRLTCGPTAEGRLRMIELPLNTPLAIAVHPGASYWPAVQMSPGLSTGPAEYTFRVQRAGTIKAKLAAASNGAAQRGCVYPVPVDVAARLAPRPGQTPISRWTSCAAADGTVVIGPVGTSAVHLFTVPEGAYGAQWLGADGAGTGDERKARAVTVKDRAQVTLPAPIRLDGRGSISGQAYPEDRVCASPIGMSAATLNIPIRACGESGQYRLDRLGPYEWPVYQYMDSSSANNPHQHYVGSWWHPDGANHVARNRDTAGRIKVTVGREVAVTGYSYITPVTFLADKLSWSKDDPGAISVHDADTGDLLAESVFTNLEAYVQAPPGRVMLRYRDADTDCWIQPAGGLRRAAVRKPLFDLTATGGGVSRWVQVRPGSTCMRSSMSVWFQGPAPRRVPTAPTGAALPAAVRLIVAAAAARVTGTTTATRHDVPTMARIARVKA